MINSRETDLVSTVIALQVENTRLIALLEAHGIAWQDPKTPEVKEQIETLATFTVNEKIALFRQLFKGRADVYPVRWESKTTGKSGYQPACANEWRPGICHKPRIKCSDCTVRQLSPLTDAIIFDHLSGEQTIGVYPLLTDDHCHFLAVDFDDDDWKDDAQAFRLSCEELAIPVAIEISRSGNGAHAWIFFSGGVLARDARRLGTAIISHTCSRTRQLKLASYDRLFPNQDTLPKGGFGNLIALPLQKKPREQGFSVFVDQNMQPYTDQWAFLAAIQPLDTRNIEPSIFRAIGSSHPLDVTFIDEEDYRTPWRRKDNNLSKLSGSLPATLTITLANQVYFEKSQLPQALANRLIRLAAFQNPEFYKAQAMRFPVWDKPRVIGCADNFPDHIGLPRGCLESALALLKQNGIAALLQDERTCGQPIDISFAGVLRSDQEQAVAEIMRHDAGILCAPTAFGKTVTAAAIISRRGVNTLILVHRKELLKQWQERLQMFLHAVKDQLGTIGGGKAKPSGKIDIAVMQSLSKQGEVLTLVENYGHIIVDECHHIGAVSFDAILKQVKAKYILGLTATPIRRDGLQPIIFMQCGPIRHTAAQPENAPTDLGVIPRILEKEIITPEDTPIQEVFRLIVEDAERNNLIVREINQLFNAGRKVLVLSERTEHLAAILAALDEHSLSIVLHGRLSKKQRELNLHKLETMPPDAPRVLLATGKLIGEGFDHPPLDTLVLAMPISWKGTLQQYAGRLHREHAGKQSVRIIDFVDSGHPALVRMWEKRQKGYKAMGYKSVSEI